MLDENRDEDVRPFCASDQPARRWADLTRRDFAALDRGRTICVMPVGAIEQHGPHLPVSVDRDLCEAVVERALAHCETSVLALPGFAYGKSNEHATVAGTLSLSARTLLMLLDDIAASLARTGFRRLVLLNAHGGNNAVLEIAARDIKISYGLEVAVCGWYAFNSADTLTDAREHRFGIHGGLVETSAMLALAPGRVDMEAAAHFPNAAEAWSDEYRHIGLTPATARPAWVIGDLNPDGACGDARAATSELGEALLANAARNFAAFLSEFARFCDARQVEQRA